MAKTTKTTNNKTDIAKSGLSVIVCAGLVMIIAPLAVIATSLFVYLMSANIPIVSQIAGGFLIVIFGSIILSILEKFS